MASRTLGIGGGGDTQRGYSVTCSSIYHFFDSKRNSLVPLSHTYIRHTVGALSMWGKSTVRLDRQSHRQADRHTHRQTDRQQTDRRLKMLKFNGFFF